MRATHRRFPTNPARSSCEFSAPALPRLIPLCPLSAPSRTSRLKTAPIVIMSGLKIIPVVLRSQPGTPFRGKRIMNHRSKATRRDFLKATGAASAAFTIVPRHVLGGEGQVPPSETFGGALIGVGGRGPGTFRTMSQDLNVKLLAAV